MANITTRSDRYQAPAAPTRAQEDLRAKFSNRLEDQPGDFRHKAISDRSLPSVAERQTLQSRFDELNGAMATDDRRAEILCTALLTAFPAYGEDAGSSATLAKMYARAVARFAPWAISEACARFIENRCVTAWNARACPTPPELVAECREVVAGVNKEMGQLKEVLTAVAYHEPSEDERQKVIDGFNKLLAELKNVGPDSVDDRKPKPPVESPEEALERIKAELKANPLKFSHPDLIPGRPGKRDEAA